MKEKIATIIIVLYNGAEFIEKCIDSVINQNFKRENYDILVIDNASTDNTYKIIKTEYPEVRIIQNGNNLGFGKANNIGIRASESKYVVLLNQDCYVDKNWLKELVNSMELNQDVACCGAKEMPYDKTISEIIRKSTDCNNQIWIGCGSAIFRRKALVQAGLFDEFYFMYDEDIDLSFTLKLLGWRIILNKNAKWHHRGHDRAISSCDDLRLFNSWKGRIYLILKFGSFEQIMNFLFFRKNKTDLKRLGNNKTNLNVAKNSHLEKTKFISKLIVSLLPRISHIIKSRYKTRKIIKHQHQVDSWITYINEQFY